MKFHRSTIFFCIILLLLSCSALNGQEAEDGSEFVISDFMLEMLPGGYFYTNFIENLAPDTTSLIEESNGFAQLDSPKVYFEGDPFAQFNWHYAGFAINSALEDGAPALQLPLFAIGSMALRGEGPQQRDYGFHFIPRSPTASRSRLMISTVFPNMGGYTALGKLAIGNHASLRADDLYTTRRKIAENFQFDFDFEKKTRLSSLLLALSYVNLDRYFNDFNRRDSQFEDKGNLLQLLSRWQRQLPAGMLTLDFVLNAKSRDHLFAEDGRYPQETYGQDSRSWLAGASWTGQTFNLKLSWLQEWQNRWPVSVDAGRDLMDIDGQGLFDFEKWGKFRATTLALDADKTVTLTWLGRKTVIQPYLRLSTVFHSAAEKSDANNAIFFNDLPYLVYLWRGNSEYSNQRRYATAGTLFKMKLSQCVNFNARLFLQYQGLDFRTAGSDLAFLQPGSEAGFDVQLGTKTNVSLSYGVLPYEMRAGVADFLEDRRSGAAIYYWTDTNRDGFFQDDEKGSAYGQSGGASHSASQTLKPSLRERLGLFLTTRLSSRFQLNIKGLYKRIHRQLWVHFAEDYGHYEEIGGQRYYLLDRPVSAYELGNVAFSKEPFYAQLSIRLQGERAKRWFFSFSFLAHIGMGYTAFGNGPTANDIGIISESEAFPNSWINGYGRVDGDRAFVGKIFFGYYLSKRLFLSASIKYRDGNPFAFLNAFKKNDQWIITYQTIKAEDEYGVKGGPREDCIWDFNFKLSHEFSLFGKKGRLELELFNLLDFGLELSENVFSAESRRLANELQLPRSLRLGVVFEI